MKKIIGYENPDMIIHLGDYVSDAKKLSAFFGDVIMVRGNNDYDNDVEFTKFVDICNIKIMLTHGHKFKVKNGVHRIKEMAAYAAENDAKTVMFGHTHEPYIRRFNGILVMNPGASINLSRKNYNPTYGIMQIENENIKLSIINVCTPAEGEMCRDRHG